MALGLLYGIGPWDWFVPMALGLLYGIGPWDWCVPMALGLLYGIGPWDWFMPATLGTGACQQLYCHACSLLFCAWLLHTCPHLHAHLHSSAAAIQAHASQRCCLVLRTSCMPRMCPCVSSPACIISIVHKEAILQSPVHAYIVWSCALPDRSTSSLRSLVMLCSIQPCIEP